MKCKCGNDMAQIAKDHDTMDEYRVSILWCNKCGRVLKTGWVLDQDENGHFTKDINDWYEPAQVAPVMPPLPPVCAGCQMPPHVCLCSHED